MAETDTNAAAFDFDPDQLTDLSNLAEAFIHEEMDAEFLEDLDHNYLTQLVDNSESQPSTEVEEGEYKAAIEVAELILDRMDAAEQ